MRRISTTSDPFAEQTVEQLIDLPGPSIARDTHTKWCRLHMTLPMRRLLLWLNIWPQFSSVDLPHLPLPMQRLPESTVLTSSSRTCFTCSAHTRRYSLHWLKKDCIACQTLRGSAAPAKSHQPDGLGTRSFETPQTNTIHPFAWNHGECHLLGPKRVATDAMRLTPRV